MNWYLVKLIYRFMYNRGIHQPQFNEQLRLICAEDTLHAFHKARLIGEKETTTVENTSGTIAWKFIDVTEILPVSNLTDGAEVWSCINEQADADMYIRSVQKQSSALLQDGICCFVN